MLQRKEVKIKMVSQPQTVASIATATLNKAKQANPNEPPLKSTAMEHIIQEAVALEYRHLWNPNGSMSRTEAFQRVSRDFVQALSEAEAKRLLVDELAYVAEQELTAAERNRRKKQ